MDLLFDLFHLLLVTPITNILVGLARLFGGNFGIAIIIFTLIMRLVTWPLTASQYRMSRAMQAMQPKVQELQKKYKGKDPKKLQAETMALYKEHGVNPLGCLLPMLVQLPIWFALYEVIRLSLADAPESLVTLSQRLYPIDFLQTAVPLERHLLFWDLGRPDTTLILPLIVGLSMYVQQKMITPTPTASTASSAAQQQAQMMTWMMPLIFGFWSLSVPAGLALYWAVTNVVGILTQYFFMGRAFDFRSLLTLNPAPQPAAQSERGVSARSRDRQQPATEPDTSAAADAAEEAAPVAATGRQGRRKRHGRRRRGKR
jgi:YidC/Oxa1 family membrane protein insertase